MIMIIRIVIPISWNKLLINLTQVWNINAQQQKKLERIIKSLKTKNSSGYDEISTKILKISCPFISSPINYICTKMLFWGVFPDRLKYAVLKPIHKNDDRCEVSNYRPVSLLTSFSKILETVRQ